MRRSDTPTLQRWTCVCALTLTALLSLAIAPKAWSQYTVTVGEVAANVGESFALPVEAEWSEEVMGYTFSVQFDALPPITGLEFGIVNTIVAEIGPEFVQSDINLISGEATLGVLFEALPPFDSTLEVLGFPIAIAYFTGTVDADAPEQMVSFAPTNGLGSPPKNNSFVVDNQSVLADTLGAGGVDIIQPLVVPEYLFIRGDVDLNGFLTLGDILYLLYYTFQGGDEPLCHDAADADDSGHADITDAIFLLNFIFLDGARPWPPYPSPGPDFTPDNISCDFSPFEG